MFVSFRWRERAALRQGPVWVNLEEVGETDGLGRLGTPFELRKL